MDENKLNNLEKNFAVLKVIADDQERRIISLENDKESLIKMTVLMEQNSEFNKQAKDQFEKMTTTMKEMNINLVNQSHVVTLIDGKLDNVTERVDGLEDQNKDRSKTISSNVWKVITGVAIATIMLIVGAIFAYIQAK